MKIAIAREALLKPLQLVSGVVERRQTLPILANVLLSIDRDGLTLTGTDLEVEMQARTSGSSVDTGDITLSARKFMDICRTLPEQAMLEISVENERALISTRLSGSITA